MPVPELHCAVGGAAPSSTVRPDGLWACRTPSWLVANPADPWMDFLLAKQQCPGPACSVVCPAVAAPITISTKLDAGTG